MIETDYLVVGAGAAGMAQVTLALDWVSMMRGILNSSALHATEPDLAAWSDRSRLSLTCGLSQHTNDPRLAVAVARWADCSEPALKNAEAFLADR